MLIAGLDPSLTATGWALLRLDALEVRTDVLFMASGVVRVPATFGNNYERAVCISTLVCEAIDTADTLGSLGMVFIERPIIIWGKGLGTAISQAILSGALAATIQQEFGLPVNALDSNEWRKTIGVPRAARLPKGQRHPPGETKRRAIARIQTILTERGVAWDKMDENELEAIGIAEAGRLEVVTWQAREDAERLRRGSSER